MLESILDGIKYGFETGTKFSKTGYMTNVKPSIDVQVGIKRDPQIDVSLSHVISEMSPGYVREVYGIIPDHSIKLDKRLPSSTWSKKIQDGLRPILQSELLRLSSYHLKGESYCASSTHSYARPCVSWLIDRDGDIFKFRIITPRNDIYKEGTREECEKSFFGLRKEFTEVIVPPNPDRIKYLESLATGFGISSTEPLFEGVDIQATRLFDSLFEWGVTKAEVSKVVCQELTDHPEEEWNAYCEGKMDGIDISAEVDGNKLRLKAVADAFDSEKMRGFFGKFEDVFIKHCEEKRT